jgi:hypothetical protein
MKLPENRVGVSDMLDYRECARRFEFKMRRWVEDDEPPEAMSASTAYGTVLHVVLHLIEYEALPDDEAIQRGFDEHGKWLDPEHLEQLEADVAIYHQRDQRGVKLVGSEMELSTPLTVVEGEQVYFRGRIDRLYQRLDNPSVFIAIDYKTSAHRKSEEEVHKDPQQWSYNWLAHEVYPEIGTLVQLYDQLRFGVVPTRKSPAQRELIKRWLQKQAIAIVRDNTLDPKWNQWCPWCPILESCSVIQRLETYALAEIAAIAPEEKQGKKTTVNLDPDLMKPYVEELPTVTRARQALERFEESVTTDVARDACGAPRGARLPAERQEGDRLPARRRARHPRGGRRRDVLRDGLDEQGQDREGAPGRTRPSSPHFADGRPRSGTTSVARARGS